VKHPDLFWFSFLGDKAAVTRKPTLCHMLSWRGGKVSRWRCSPVTSLATRPGGLMIKYCASCEVTTVWPTNAFCGMLLRQWVDWTVPCVSGWTGQYPASVGGLDSTLRRWVDWTVPCVGGWTRQYTHDVSMSIVPVSSRI
jgi:hypothetical protein